MIIEYLIHKDGLVSYTFDKNGKEETYLQSISDKSITFIQRNKGEREFVVVEVPHFKGINILHQCSWGFDDSCDEIKFFIIPKNIIYKCKFETYSHIEYEEIKTKKLEWLNYKTASNVYLTKINKKYLHIKEKKFYDVKE